jgi:hypothetical protein
VATGVVLVVFAGGGAAAWAFKDRLLGALRGVPEAPATQAAPAPPAVAAPAPPVAPETKAPEPAPPKPAPAAAAAAPAAKAPEPARAEPAPKPKPPAPTRVAAAEPQRSPSRAEPAPKPEPPAAPAPAKKKVDPLLDFDSSGDGALDEALGGTPSGRTVYVPPRPGSELPDKLSASQINEAVLTQVDSLRRCVSDQKARDPDASGTLKMRWLILGDGGVRDVKCLTPEYASGPFATCIAGVVKSIRFPRSATKGQEVTFPFTF